jgi:2-polyprenyl-3-methyl-5-hydroxy-6-metoxy-1,4-benzoquinol methylase
MKSEVFWDKMSSNYESQVKKYQQTYTDTIERTKKYLKNEDIVLDFACGTGIETLHISGFVRAVHPIDISEKMIDIAEEKVKQNEICNIKFYKTDLLNEDLKKLFDIVLAFNILYFLKNVPENLSKIYELLKPGDLFISTTDCIGEKISILNRIKYCLSRIGILPFMKMYSIFELEDLVTDVDFKIIETANLYDNPPNYFIAA